jgi:putative ABC transport system permease protein
MAKAQGINISVMKVIGLALSNGIVAFSGGLMAQFQGFADINMGKGAIVIGLAAVIIGEVAGDAIAGKKLNFAGRLSFVVVGGILYYLTVVIVLWLRLNSNMLKFFTAIIVAIFLAIPNITNYSKNSFSRAGKNSLKYVKGNED